ncbi:triose-phosphate isomerase [Crenobacter caeni]|uniref:Triosephosphate isomerase n=1 Tax=Crenobacter caeni TaxID=2705474 RepID=A0A6B2KP95_9NEIS|nr:triose-phosphate isomerase [Crenobacter caeni]NDV11988.1 triose-phosphate isomerase [Crenobacter caeni]
MSEKLVIGNWKMNGRTGRNADLLRALKALPEVCREGVGVAPPAAYLGQLAAALEGTPLALCAQDVSRFAGDGAYTGEVSAAMLADLGVRYVLVGHSERRQYFGEDNAVLTDKLEACHQAGLIPVLCVGETLAEREAGAALAVIRAQLSVLEAYAGRSLVVAYEPVWAIGTGKVAETGQIEEIHQEIKKWLLQCGRGADNIRVLYGGSVKADNAEAIFSVPGVDGALVGGASLDAETFKSICNAA